MDTIFRSEIMREPHRWISYTNFEGKKVFRELAPYGNRHAVFDMGAEIGYVHLDQYNAITQPISHLVKWGNEKKEINEELLRLFVYGLALYGIYKLGKYFDDNF